MWGQVTTACLVSEETTDESPLRRVSQRANKGQRPPEKDFVYTNLEPSDIPDDPTDPEWTVQPDPDDEEHPDDLMDRLDREEIRRTQYETDDARRSNNVEWKKECHAVVSRLNDMRAGKGQSANDKAGEDFGPIPMPAATVVVGDDRYLQSQEKYKELIEQMETASELAKLTPAYLSGVPLERIIKVHAGTQFASETVIGLMHEVVAVFRDVDGIGPLQRDEDLEREFPRVFELRTMGSLVGTMQFLAPRARAAADAAGLALPVLEGCDTETPSSDDFLVERLDFTDKHACTIVGHLVVFSTIRQVTSLRGDHELAGGVSVTVTSTGYLHSGRSQVVQCVRTNSTSVRIKWDAQASKGSGLAGFGEDGEPVVVQAERDMIVLQGPMPLDAIKSARSFPEMLARSAGLNLADGSASSWAFCGAHGGIAGDGSTSGGTSVSVGQSADGLAFLEAMKVRVVGVACCAVEASSSLQICSALFLRQALLEASSGFYADVSGEYVSRCLADKALEIRRLQVRDSFSAILLVLTPVDSLARSFARQQQLSGDRIDDDDDDADATNDDADVTDNDASVTDDDADATDDGNHGPWYSSMAAYASLQDGMTYDDARYRLVGLMLCAYQVLGIECARIMLCMCLLADGLHGDRWVRMAPDACNSISWKSQQSASNMSMLMALCRQVVTCTAARNDGNPGLNMYRISSHAADADIAPPNVVRDVYVEAIGDHRRTTAALHANDLKFKYAAYSMNNAEGVYSVNVGGSLEGSSKTKGKMSELPRLVTYQTPEEKQAIEVQIERECELVIAALDAWRKAHEKKLNQRKESRARDRNELKVTTPRYPDRKRRREKREDETSRKKKTKAAGAPLVGRVLNVNGKKRKRTVDNAGVATEAVEPEQQPEQQPEPPERPEGEQPFQFTINSSRCDGPGSFRFGENMKDALLGKTVSAGAAKELHKALQAELEGKLAEDKYPCFGTLEQWVTYWRHGATKGYAPPPWLVGIAWNGVDLGDRPQRPERPEGGQPFRFTINSSRCDGPGSFRFGENMKGELVGKTVSAGAAKELADALQAELAGKLAKDKYPALRTLDYWVTYWRHGATEGYAPPPWLVGIVWNGVDLGDRPEGPRPSPPKNKNKKMRSS